MTVSRPGYHMSSLAHSFVLHCLKIGSGSQCSTILTVCNAAALKVSTEGTGLLEQWVFSAQARKEVPALNQQLCLC